MATRRITVLTTTDEDLAAIRAVAPEPDIAGQVVVADVEDEDIARLESQGVIVQAVERKETVEPGALAPPLTPMMAAAIREELPGPAPDFGEAAEAQPAATDVYVLSVDGPLLPLWRSQLEQAGAELLERVEQGDLTARIAIENVPPVRALPFVTDLRLFTASDTADIRQLASQLGPPAAGAEQVTFDALVHPGVDAGTVTAWLRDHAVDVCGSSRRKVRFFALRGAPVLDEFRGLPEVSSVEEFVPPRLANDRARALLGLDTAAPDADARTGKGQIVAIADTGLDEKHPDFAGRVRKVIARGRANDASDPVGHGTHVAGSVLGGGSASNGQIRGAAPEAELIFQSVLDADGGLGGLGLDLAELFDEAYADGARIHSNSWGALAQGAYRMNSLEVDSFVHEHPDMLVIIAAGNSGSAANPVVAHKGFVDLLSVDAPGTAKNALTVGASRSDRRMDGQGLTFGRWWPNNFPDPPIADAELSGDPEGLAAFSGRGPCNEQIRMKPDLVAPGTFILSTRSSLAPTKEFWAEYPQDRHYAYMGGTSMSTPLVAGCAALVRQYYVDERQHTPTAALMKATLVNGAHWLSAEDAVADHPTEPNYHQGFGCVKMPASLPGSDNAFALMFRDTEGTQGETLAETGARAQYVLNARDGELRFCLAWTDPPGRGIQNTITLVVERTGSGERWLGNPHRPPGVVGWDAGNNVQVIRLPDAKGGTYRVSLIAANLLAPQAFALVATGQLDSELAQVY